jgi:D-citramalate synthase
VTVAREKPRYVSVMDTTLRDGEQTPDVAYSPAEKLQLARFLLDELRVDRIEIAQSRVSEGEREAARLIARWARGARRLPRIEILGYCDGKLSVDWILGTGGRVLNLLVKGSELHCRSQLRMEPAEHRAAVAQTIRYARRRKLVVNVYLEDWSNGVRDSRDYVVAMVNLLREQGALRIYLPDTLGVFAPDDVSRYVRLMVRRWPSQCFEFHAHNDYGLATANCLAALAAGARGVHTSVNGMGERTGNTRLAEVVAAIHDHSKFRTRVREDRLSAVSRLVEVFSGKDVAANTPIVGRDVFTQTGGIHADGDLKADLYTTRLAPGRFGRQRRYALGKLSGKASVEQNLKALGIGLTAADRDLVLKRVIELGDKKGILSIEDLPYIIDDVLKRPDELQVRVTSWAVHVGTAETPDAELTLSFRGRTEKARASGDGGYDAFMNALAKAARRFQLELPRLEDFRVRIPPGGRTEALVETAITWRRPAAEGTFSTRGVDSDQLAAAVIATEKMLNVIAPRPKAARTPRRRSASRP